MDSASTGLTPMTPAALARLAADADVGVVLAGAATPAPTGAAGPGGGGISGGTPPPYGCAPSAPIPIPARGLAGGRSAPVAIPRPGAAAAAVAGGGDPMALMADVAAACGRQGVGASASVVDDAVVAAGSAGAAGAAAGAGGLAAASAPAAFSMLTASPGSTCDGASVASRSPFSVGGGGGGLGGASAALLAAAGGGGGTAGNGGSTAGSPYTSSLPLPLYAGSFSSIDDEHVTVWEPATGKTVAGNAAPYRRNLSTWLLTHGGWEEKADELKSSKRRSAARRAKAASASFANLCVCTPVVAALLADARQRAAVVAAAPADEAKGAGDTAATVAAALAASAATPGTSPAAGVGHLPYASEWPADLRVRLQEALVRLGEETHAAGRDMGTLHPERWRALTASVGGGKTEEETLAMTIDVLSRGLAVHAHATASLASFGGPAGSSGSLPESSHGSLDMSGLAMLSALGGDEARNLSAAGGGLATAAAVSAANGVAAAATGAANGTAGILSTSPAVGHCPLSSSVPAGGDFLGSLAGGFRTAREPRVTVWEPATGRTLSGNAAPCRRNLGAWMASHPGWLPKAEEQLSSSRRARNRKSILGAGGVLTPLGVFGGGADGDGDGDGGMDDDDGPDGGGGGAAADAGSGAATAAAATATPAMPIPVPGGGRGNELPSAAALDAAELGASVPLSPALSDALEGLLLMSGSSPGAAPGVSIPSGAGGSLRGASFGGGSHLGGASVGGGSQFGGVSVGGGSSVGGVVEAMVNMSVAVEGVVPVGAGADDDGGHRERVLCGKRATPSSSSEHSSGFTEESGAGTTPSPDAMDDAGGEVTGGGRVWDRGGKGVPPDGNRRSKRISAASMSMDMEL